jgi:hypothetical protein
MAVNIEEIKRKFGGNGNIINALEPKRNYFKQAWLWGKTYTYNDWKKLLL